MEGPQSDRIQLGLRFLHPDIKGTDRFSFFTGLYRLSISVPVSKKMDMMGRMTVGHIAPDYGETQTSIGNIYAAVRYQVKDTEKKKVNLSLGIYLPTANRNNPSSLFIGLLSDYSRQFHFYPETTTLSLNGSFYHFHPNGLFLGVELGPDVMIPPAESRSDEAELFVHYGLTAGYRFTDVEIKAEWTGLGIISAKVDDFGDRFVNEAVFGLKYTRGRVHPGLFYKINLKKWIRESIRGAFGFSIDVVVN
ncbi:MAG: hypothetical protein GY940_04455 [bacterium]|nr:hypothetical protein [bacterium]